MANQPCLHAVQLQLQQGRPAAGGLGGYLESGILIVT
jgi:hypothetical protein